MNGSPPMYYMIIAIIVYLVIISQLNQAAAVGFSAILVMGALIVNTEMRGGKNIFTTIGA